MMFEMFEKYADDLVNKIEDTTGAGDTFAGNLAYHLTNGYTLYDAIERSQYASAMKIMTKTMPS